jgi:hypothetical protein
MYQALILAAWYKKKVRESLLAKAYVDRNKTAGVAVHDPRAAEKIWTLYVEAFKKGAYNFIREETDSATNELIPRKYFSGGGDFSRLTEALRNDGTIDTKHFDASQDRNTVEVNVDLVPAGSDAAMVRPTSKYTEEGRNLFGFNPDFAIAKSAPVLAFGVA